MIGYKIVIDQKGACKEEIPERVRGELATRVGPVSSKLSCDIFWYSGDIFEGIEPLIYECFESNKKRENLAFLLTTDGGSPDAAYRIARCAQRFYGSGKIYLFVHSRCKSAGTLMAVGFNEIIMSDTAELGPLDMQVNKNDELDERTSSLISLQALSTLNAEIFKAFEQHFVYIRKKSARQITTRSAAHIAVRLAIGSFARIYQQIDPVKLGELYRTTQIAFEYGIKLAAVGRNIPTCSIQKLILGYPSHEFVVDREEAEGLFRTVKSPSREEKSLWSALEKHGQLAPETTAGFSATFGFVSGPLVQRSRRGDTGATNGKSKTSLPRNEKSRRLSETARPNRSNATRRGMGSSTPSRGTSVGPNSNGSAQGKSVRTRGDG